ncbi:MAG: ABC transporter ATP-binding protein [Acidimicrobiales bacterium]
MIELVDVVKRYGDVVACNRLDLAVDRGELVTLLGPSGCGKTTALRCITGSLRPDSGRIIIDGRDVTDVPTHKRNIGVVFQNFALFPHMTVLDNVAYPLRVRGIGPTTRRERALEAIRLVQLEGLGERFPRELSGGQQQRVGLARAIVYEPNVVLFDEPLSNLDAKLRLEMREEVSSLTDRLGFTSIYVTHDQEEALSLSDRIAVMKDGIIHQVGRPSEVYAEPRTAFVAEFLGNPNSLTGVCVERAENWVVVEAAGQRITSTAGSDTPKVAERAVVFVRPESVQIRNRTDSADENSLRATVVRSAFLGDSTEYILSLNDDVSWRLRLDLSIRLTVGDSVELSVPRASSRAFGLGGRAEDGPNGIAQAEP